MLKWAICYCVGAWFYDVSLRPQTYANEARQEANKRGKPMLNIGAGTWGSSVATSLFGPTLWGDVNLDFDSKIPLPDTFSQIKKETVYHGNIYKIPFPDKFFGSLLASHVLEHLEEPEKGIKECERVADQCFFVTPAWWGLHTWVSPDHKWYRKQNGEFVKLGSTNR